LREDVGVLVEAAAKADYPHEKADISRQSRLLIREALDARAKKPRHAQAPLEIPAPDSNLGRLTINLRQDVWELVRDSAEKEFPFDEPNVSKQTRALILEALAARRGK